MEHKKLLFVREELDNVQMLITTTAAECGMLRTQLKDPENKLAVGLALRSDVALLEQHENEGKRLEREIQRIEQNLPQTGMYTYGLNCIAIICQARVFPNILYYYILHYTFLLNTSSALQGQKCFKFCFGNPNYSTEEVFRLNIYMK
jgi:hypothetical protein